MSYTAFPKVYRANAANTANIVSTVTSLAFGERLSNRDFNRSVNAFLQSWSFQKILHIPFLELPFPIRLYRLTVCKSLFSMMVNPSIVKPLGLSSLLLELSSRQVVTRLLSVTLLARMIICLAYVLA